MPNDEMLRRTLISNALFSTVSAALGLAFAPALALATAIPTPAVQVVSAGLLPFAAACAFASADPARRTGLVRAIYLADVTWVVATLPALCLPLTALGRGLLVDLALVVATLAWFERRGLRARDAEGAAHVSSVA